MESRRGEKTYHSDNPAVLRISVELCIRDTSVARLLLWRTA